jgi:hypothetical protein
VTISGSTILIHLISPVVYGDVITVSYLAGGVNKIQDPSGNDASAFIDHAVNNNTVLADTTPPTVATKTTTSATNIRIVFSEAVTATLPGWSFKKNGSALAASAISGSGTTWDFTVGTMASGDILVVSYDSATGDTKDGSNNELVSFTDSTVSNTISPSYDTDAQTAFTAIEAAEGSALSSTVKTAYNNWVLREKAASRYTKYGWIYPMLGATAGAHAINAKAPGTNNLTFNGTGWTHTANGIKSNKASGTNANLGFAPSALAQNDNHMMVRVGENLADGYPMGSYAAGAGGLAIGTIGGGTYTRDMTASAINTTGITNAIGMHMITRVTSTEYVYVWPASSAIISVASDGKGVNNILLGDLGGLTGNGSAAIINFATVGTGFTQSEALAARTSLNTLMTDLSR